jgi:hypothetical protein
MVENEILCGVWAAKDRISEEIGRNPVKWFAAAKRDEAVLKRQGFKFADALVVAHKKPRTKTTSRSRQIKMRRKRAHRTYLFCLDNSRYLASLEVRKVYRAIPDAAAKARGFVRVIDESGEDYLYPVERFVAVRLPIAASRVVAGAS